MQPIVHPVVGYICYAAYTRGRDGESPRDLPALVAVVAATLPDLIDQPLYHAGVTPVGRTVGHSLLGAVPLVVLAWLLARRWDRQTLGVAFAVGYASHIAADIPWHLLSGDSHELGFLLWPITHMPPYSGVKSLGTIGGLEVTTLALEAVIFLAGVALWWRDGRPGLVTLRRALSVDDT